MDKQKLTKVDLEKPVPMGIALSLQENGHVDSIILCCYRRALIIRIRQAVTRWQSKELLLDKSDDLARLLYGKLSVEYKKIQLAGFHAALQVKRCCTATSSMRIHPDHHHTPARPHTEPSHPSCHQPALQLRRPLCQDRR